MRIKKHVPTLFALTAVLTLGVALYVNVNNRAPIENSAAQVNENFSPYTYTGTYYSDHNIDFDAGDGMDGALRIKLKNELKPKGFVEYSEGLSEHLQEADEDPNNPNNMVMFYTRNSITKTPANNGGMVWNREHVWPKNKSNDNWGTTQGGTDILHLRPTYETPNSTRSNHPYGTARNGSKKTYNNMDYGWLDGDLFEPLDCVKGDAARIIMYVWTIYNGYSGYNPLSITSVFESYNTLLKWHTEDKPDELEGHRNDYVQFETIQKNRNPFVDHPELAWKIFGDQVDANVKSACMAAYPAGGSVHIDPTGITLNKSSASVEVGKVLQLTASLQPSGATGTITWSSNHSNIASVNSNGKVTGVATGTATITATCGSYSASCLVTVTEPQPTNYGTLTNPLTVEEAKALIDSESPTLDKMYVKGIVTSSTYNSQYNNFDDVYLKDDSSDTALSVFRSVLGEGVDEKYKVSGALVGKEIVACGYGILYNNVKYELAKENGHNFVPTIVKVNDPSVIEKTPKELIEEKTTSTSLAYNYTKQTSGDASATDTLTRTDTGATNTNYVDWSHTSTTSGITYTGQSAGDKGSIQLRSKNANSGIVVSDNANNKKVSSVTVSWNTNTSSGRTLNVYGKNTTYTDPTDLYNTNKQGTLLGTIVYGTSTSLTITGDYKFIGVRSNESALFLEDITFQWGGSSTTYEYSNVTMRFGGVIEKELWSKLDTDEHVITGFGVVIVDADIVDNDDDFIAAIRGATSSTISIDIEENLAIDYFVPIANISIIGSDDDNYFWNLRYVVSDLTKEYAAAAYIKTTSESIYLKRATYSAKTLAADYLNNRNCDETTAGGSLANLAAI